jgi:alkylhydroperoxidase family enzyme
VTDEPASNDDVPARQGMIAWPAPDDLDDRQRTVYDAIAGGPRSKRPRSFPLADEVGRLYGPFNAMVISPAVGMPLQQLGAAIRYASGLSDRLREMIILRVAVLRRSDFEWQAHVGPAAAADVQAGELDLVTTGAFGELGEPEASVLGLVDHLVRDRGAPEELVAHIAELIGEPALIEVVVTVGYYDLLALSMATLRVPLPPGADPIFTPGESVTNTDGSR